MNEPISTPVDLEPCPSCGARLGGRAGCQAGFDQLSAQAWTSRSRAAAHNLVVDAYALQHPEEYCRSPKSYAAHLIGLCCGLENAGDSKLYWAIPRWLDGPATLEKPAVLEARGVMTVAEVQAVRSEQEYPERVARWAQAVWTAYAAQHDLARRWLNAVRAHMTQASGRANRG